MVDRRRRVNWTENARTALSEALDYIAQESPEGAIAVMEQALSAARGLSVLSKRGRVVPELSDPTIREIFVFNYRLLYEVSGDDINILAFLHGARDFAKWRGQE